MITFKEYMQEARKNPEMNPKISAYQHLKLRYEKVTGNITTKVKNLFVSFTTIEKLGINPKSEYDTPLGIYAYPAQYVMKEIHHSHEDMTMLPFAGDSPFVNIFEATGNIINISSFTKPAAMKYYKKLGQIYSDYYKKANPKIEKNKAWKFAVDDLESVINRASRLAKDNSPGGQFWYVLISIVRKLSNIIGTPAPVIWNKVMREMDIDGVVDLGKGIIHSNEPTQAVFFHIGAIKDNKRYDNKWSKYDIEQGQRVEGFVENAKEVLKKTPEEFEKILADGFKNYKTINLITYLKKLKPDNAYNLQIFFSKNLITTQKRAYFNEMAKVINKEDFVRKMFNNYKLDDIAFYLYELAPIGSWIDEMIDLLNHIADRLVKDKDKIKTILKAIDAKRKAQLIGVHRKFSPSFQDIVTNKIN